MALHLSFSAGPKALRENLITYFTNQALVAALLLTIIAPLVLNPIADVEEELLAFFTLTSAMMLTLGLFLYVALLDVLCKLAGDLTILEGVRRLGFAMWAAQSFMATGLVLAVAAVGFGATRLYTYSMGLLATMVVSALCVALFIVALSAANRVILVANQMQLDHSRIHLAAVRFVDRLDSDGTDGVGGASSERANIIYSAGGGQRVTPATTEAMVRRVSRVGVDGTMRRLSEEAGAVEE